MLNSLNAGVSGIRTYQSKLDVIGNNIANSNTLAFKSASANFSDTFSQTLAGGSEATGALQVGSGVQTATIKNNFARGSYQKTGNATDLYIDGDQGFFTVRNPEGGTFATRAGDFVIREGYLCTKDGYRVQGYTDHVATNGTMATLGDIRIEHDANTSPVETEAGVTMDTFEILPNGRVHIRLSDDQSYDVGQVLLQRYQDTSMLEKDGNNLYRNTDAAGAIGNPVPPNTNGTGPIKSGALEMSNVDLAGEFADLITTQRGFQANARIITTSDEMLQEVVNLKR